MQQENSQFDQLLSLMGAVRWDYKADPYPDAPKTSSLSVWELATTGGAVLANLYGAIDSPEQQQLLTKMLQAVDLKQAGCVKFQSQNPLPILCLGATAKNAVVQAGAVAPLYMVASLQDLLSDNQLKRQAWSELQVLRDKINA